MRINLSAYTAPGCNYPPFLSVNTEDGSSEVEIIVRSEVKPDGRCGDTASIKIDAANFERVLRELASHFPATLEN